MNPSNRTLLCRHLLDEFRYDFELRLPEQNSSEFLQIRYSLYEPWRAQDHFVGFFSPETSPRRMPGEEGEVLRACRQTRVAWCVYYIIEDTACRIAFLKSLFRNRTAAGVLHRHRLGLPEACPQFIIQPCMWLLVAIAMLPDYATVQASGVVVFSALARLEAMVAWTAHYKAGSVPWLPRTSPLSVRHRLEHEALTLSSPLAAMVAGTAKYPEQDPHGCGPWSIVQALVQAIEIREAPFRTDDLLAPIGPGSKLLSLMSQRGPEAYARAWHAAELESQAILRSVRSCARRRPRRVAEWLLSRLPVWRLLERSLLAPVVAVRAGYADYAPLRQWGVSGGDLHLVGLSGSGESWWRRAEARGTCRELRLAVLPVRDYVSDILRLSGVPACFNTGLPAAVEMVLQSRHVGPEAPLWLAEVGANLGDCALHVLACLGPERARAILVEPVLESFRRLAWSVGANGFGRSAQLVRAAIGPSNGHLVIGGPNHDIANHRTLQVSPAASAEGATRGAARSKPEAAMVVPAYTLNALFSGVELDILVVARPALEGVTPAASAALLNRTPYFVSGRCVMRGSHVIGADLGPCKPSQKSLNRK